MGDWILSISSYLWVVSILALMAAFFVPTDKSSRFSAAVWIVMGLIMDRAAPLLTSLSDWDEEFARVAWYSVWAMFNTVTILIIWTWHQRSQWQLSLLSKYISVCCVAMVSLQALRQMDRVLFETNMLGAMYKFGVPAINIAVIGAIVIWAVKSVVRKVPV